MDVVEIALVDAIFRQAKLGFSAWGSVWEYSSVWIRRATSKVFVLGF